MTILFRDTTPLTPGCFRIFGIKALEMEATYSSEVSVTTYKTVYCRNPEEHHKTLPTRDSFSKNIVILSRLIPVVF